jgi:hypothetical protein
MAGLSGDTQMKYVVPFSKLKKSIRVVSSDGQLKADLTYEELMHLIKLLLVGVPVDDVFYRTSYPDVAEAIDAGVYRDAKHHFVDYGYFEGRRPFEPEVDETWYIQKHEDVQKGIADGSIKSAAAHFAEHGYDEGREPMRL